MTNPSTARWHCRNLGDAMLAAPRIDELCATFKSAALEGDCIGGLFIRHEAEGQLHCAVKVYFSPAASAVAKKLGATPCASPAKEGLSLLAGDPQSWVELEGL